MLTRRMIIRISVIVSLILLGFFLYIVGKEHKVFIDNKEISSGNIIYSAEDSYKVWMDNQEIGVVKKGQRKVAKVVGVSHKVTLQKIRGKDLTGPVYERKFKLNPKEGAVLNIPALINTLDEGISKVNNS